MAAEVMMARMVVVVVVEVVAAASGALTWSPWKGKANEADREQSAGSVPNRDDPGFSSRWKLIGNPLLAHPSSRWIGPF